MVWSLIPFKAQLQKQNARMLLKENSYHIDLHSYDGGTIYIGNIGKGCFNNNEIS